uniref:Neurotransmitter-gated ion-channel transmembrane domain-containing protein n=1 Tax=Romanomermis culicivorax TaxID=13658 RepID=A0A915JI79_ROMCU
MIGCGFIDGYSTEDIKLHWHDDGHSPVKIDEHLRLPTFTMDDMIVEETDQILSTGNYSRLSCKFKFIRSIRYYYLQIYQPSVFVVATSWVSFWIDRESAPARVTLCITAILTMTTLTSLTSEQMPKVGYAKAVDIYLVVCYFMVFGALMEYALISYLIVGEKATKQKRRISPLPQKVDYVVAGIYCSSQDSSDRAANNLTKRKITVTV